MCPRCPKQLTNLKRTMENKDLQIAKLMNKLEILSEVESNRRTFDLFSKIDKDKNVERHPFKPTSLQDDAKLLLIASLGLATAGYDYLIHKYPIRWSITALASLH